MRKSKSDHEAAALRQGFVAVNWILRDWVFERATEQLLHFRTQTRRIEHVALGALLEVSDGILSGRGRDGLSISVQH